MPFSRDLIQLCAEVALQRQDYDRALAMARKIAAGESKNYGEQLWLGRMLSIIGSRIKADGKDKESDQLFANAEAALRRAVKLEPKLATTWTALVRHYILAGDPDKAKKATEEAAKNLPPKDAAMALAQCYDVMGMVDAAAKEYGKALAAAPGNIAVIRAAADFYVRSRQAELAEPLLLKIIDGTVKAEPPGHGLGPTATGLDLCLRTAPIGISRRPSNCSSKIALPPGPPPPTSRCWRDCTPTTRTGPNAGRRSTCSRT